MAKIIERLSEGMDVPQDFKVFLINFYAESLVALLIDWIEDKNRMEKEK